MRTFLLFLGCLFSISQPFLIAASGDRPAVTTVGLPRLFILNEGQWDTRIRAASFGVGPTISFGAGGYSIGIPTKSICTEVSPSVEWPTMRFRKAGNGMRLSPGAAWKTGMRYYDARMRGTGTTRFPQYRSLRYEEVRPGVCVEIEGGSGSLLHSISFNNLHDGSDLLLRFDHVRREQLAVVCDGGGGGAVTMRESAGGVDVAVTPPAAPRPFTVSIGLNFFWGGSNDEEEVSLEIDRAEHIHVAGVTRSVDFPLIPTGQPEPVGFGIYAMECSADGKDIFYSTYLNIFGSQEAYIAIDQHDRLVLVAQSSYLDNLATPDAQYHWATGTGLFIIDSSGAIAYGSGMPERTLNYINGVRSDGGGNIYVLAHCDTTPGYITADALFASNQGEQDGLLLKFDAEDHRLLYATCLGTPGEDWFDSFAIDGCGGVAYVNSHFDPNAQNPDSSALGWYMYDVGRISSDGRRFIFRRSFSGGRKYSLGWLTQGWLGLNNSRLIDFDRDENMYFASATSDERFPVVGGTSSMPGSDADIVIGKLSPSGELLYSTYLGSQFHDFVSALVADSCGRILVHGGFTDDRVTPPVFPLVNPLYTDGNHFLVSIDSRSGMLEFSTLLRWTDLHYGGDLILAGTSAYLVGATDDLFGLPPTPGLRPFAGPYGGVDAMITRIDLPELCPKPRFPLPRNGVAELATTITSLDTIRIDVRRQIVSPSAVLISARIRNLSDRYLADSIQFIVDVPSGLKPLAGSPALSHTAGSPAPLDSTLITWRLQPDLDGINPATMLRGVLIGSSGGACPTPVELPFEIPVVYTDVPDAEFRCQLSLSSAFAVTPDTTRLSLDSMLVTLRISNISNRTGNLHAAILRIPSGIGMTLLAPTDSLVVPHSLPGNSSVELQWLIGVKSWPFGRPSSLAAVLVDTFGLVVAECELREDIPGTFGSICALEVSDPIHVRADDSTFVPDPVLAMLQIDNPCDSLRPYHDLRLDLSSAPHLKPVTGENLWRPPFTIEADSSQGFSWQLRVFPPPNQNMTETVRAIYRTNSDTTERSCAFKVRILRLGADIDCAVVCADSLFLDGATARFTEDTLAVRAMVRNTGSLAQEIRDVLLTVSPAGAAQPLDPLLRSLPALGPGKSDTINWNLHVPVLPVPHSIRFDVTVTAANGGTLSSCAKNVFVPAPSFACTVQSPDSIRYDLSTDSYVPSLFEVTAQFENRTDTVLTNLRAALDTSILQRARLLDAATAEQFLPQLPPRQTWDVRWTLEPSWADRPFDQRLRVRFFADELPAGTICERVVSIDGAPRTVSLRCETAGHDSVWADTFYEAMIPDPVQIQYTIHNEGPASSSGCSIAILPPPMLELIAGEDSIRLVPALLPGESFSAEWKLRIIEGNVTLEPWVIRWQNDCEGLSGNPACEHRLTFIDRSPAGVVLTPWLLRFEAERGGPLPAAQDLQLWTGNGDMTRWNVTAIAPWLDASPSSGAGHTIMSAVPNTTALTPGAHSGTLALSELPLSSGQIQVIYDIRTKLGTARAPDAADLRIGSLYPNPVPAGMPLTVGYLADPGASVRFEIHDLLGRIRSTAAQETTASGAGSLRMPTTGLQPGTYLVALRSGGHVDVRLLMVIQ
ncbi:MAG: T9SS type A sorting domain-containing protein [Bacteroidetes bacterium]|nr:T9SS type A sorting domain-containing protein [Bacteroidota bacterium]